MTHFEQNSKAHQMHREHEKRARGAKLLEGELTLIWYTLFFQT